MKAIANFKCEPEYRAYLMSVAKSKGLSLSEMLRRAVALWLDSQGVSDESRSA